MMVIHSARKALFALGVAGTLGFGATQALAAPGEPAKALQCFPECEEQCGPPRGTMLRNGVCICCSDGTAQS